MYLSKVIRKFNEYNKWKEFFNFKTIEGLCPLICSTIFIWILYFFKFYKEFDHFEEIIKSVLLAISSSFIGMLGIILAGIAIIVGMLNKDIKNTIEKINNEEKVIEKILFSFLFLSFITALNIFIFLSIYIIIHSSKSIIPEIYFYISVWILCYLFFFNIFYVISLISNCIKIFLITTTYNEIFEEKKKIHDIANEIRIDYILKLLDVKRENLLTDLINITKKREIQDDKKKRNVINYFKNYYS